MPPWADERWVSVAEAAALLAVSNDTVIRMIKRNELEGWQLRPRSPRIIRYRSLLPWLPQEPER